MLEVIALDAADAEAAAAGGADRLEVVSDMASDGLTPSVATVKEIAAATDLPQRVMLRANAGFQTGRDELRRLAEAASELADAGAEGFVFGFLDAEASLDEEAVLELIEATSLPWTFHRAIDNSLDPAEVWSTVNALPRLDAVLTAGAAGGVAAGMDVLLGREPSHRLLVGGGLKLDHLDRLYDAGVRGFHIGSAARSGWDRPVEAEKVRLWRDRLDTLAG